jgi:hypothetical protein
LFRREGIRRDREGMRMEFFSCLIPQASFSLK